MAVKPPITIGLAGTTFLLTAETGGLIQSFSRATNSKVIDVYDASLGYTVGSVYHDFFADYNVKIITTGGSEAPTGIFDSAPGVPLTLASISSGNGVDGGGIYTRSTTLDHQGGQLQEFTAVAKQFPGVD